MYVVYNVNTTLFLRVMRRGYWDNAVCATKAACAAAITRAEHKAIAKSKPFDRNEWAIAEEAHFHANIEKQVTKKNLLSGKEFTQPINTPASCDPSTETYHCM